jgi:hypothetical protein
MRGRRPLVQGLMASQFDAGQREGVHPWSKHHCECCGVVLELDLVIYTRGIRNACIMQSL